MKNKYRFLANIVHWFHFFWLILLVVSFYIWISTNNHREFLCVGLITALAQVSYKGSCPLTLLENWLRKKDDSKNTYEQGFISYHIDKWFGVEVKDSTITTIMLISTIVLSVIVVRNFL